MRTTTTSATVDASVTHAATKITTTQSTPEQIASAWTEHKSPEGVPYYHNSITKKSQYDKPMALLALRSAATNAKEEQTKRPWTEYTDAATGKKYYSNGVTTSWEKPSSVAPSITTTTEELFTTTSSGETSSRKKAKAFHSTTQFGNKDEAIAAFKGLLIAKDVSPTLKWNELTKLYSKDDRWQACGLHLTTGERRQALSEYQTKRANELRQLAREEKLRAKQFFYDLLHEAVPRVPGFSAWNTRFEQVRDALAVDDRFHAVAEESTRESIFLDFCQDFRKREERKKRSIKRETQENFLSFLKEKEEQGVLTFASTWKSFLSSLGGDALSDNRFAVSPSMSDADRELYFADFVIELQSAEDEKRRRIRDARRRAEQAQRDAFRDVLRNLAIDGKLFPWSQWREVESSLVVDPSYGPLNEQSPEAPRDMFEEFVDDWHTRYRRDRVLLGKMVRPTTQTQLVVSAATSYETFTKALLDTASSNAPELLSDAKQMMNRADPISNIQVYFHELRAIGESAKRALRGSALRRSNYASSEDEGEIIEDGEVNEEKQPLDANVKIPTKDEVIA